jgi:hypothetical protein
MVYQTACKGTHSRSKPGEYIYIKDQNQKKKGLYPENCLERNPEGSLTQSWQIEIRPPDKVRIAKDQLNWTLLLIERNVRATNEATGLNNITCDLN